MNKLYKFLKANLGSRLWLPLLIISIAFNAYFMLPHSGFDNSAEITLDNLPPHYKDTSSIKDILKANISNSIKKELIGKEVYFGYKSKGLELHYLLLINQAKKSCIENKCLTYIFHSTKNGLVYIATTYVNKDRVYPLDIIFPESEETTAVNCDVIFSRVCIFNDGKNPDLKGKRFD